jgi:hypothetical protein
VAAGARYLAPTRRVGGGRSIAPDAFMAWPVRIVWFQLALVAVTSGAGCGVEPAGGEEGAGGKGDDLGGDHPPGCAVACDLEETVLIAGGGGTSKLAIQRLGSDPVRIEVPVGSSGRFVHGTSRAGLFFALFSDGLVATIDGRSGEVVSEVAVEGVNPFAVEVRSPTEAFVSFRGSPDIVELDPSTGEVLATIDVAAAGVSDVGARHMLVVGDELYVAASLGTQLSPRGTHLAVIDLGTGAVVRRADLVWTDPVSGATQPALNPDLPLVLDERRGRLFVGAKGKRPSNTGMTLKVDLDSLATASDRNDLSSTFNGHQVISQRFEVVLALEHTSTPVASTHVSRRIIEADGRVVDEDRPTLLDLFEETDALSINGDGTVAMIANSCPVGFCTEGIGVNFIDVGAAAMLPKLTDDQIGFSPVDSVFLQD